MGLRLSVMIIPCHGMFEWKRLCVGDQDTYLFVWDQTLVHPDAELWMRALQATPPCDGAPL